MALQTSGAISLANVQSEFGGSNPVGMAEYYRGGSYVPTTVGGAAGSWSSYYGNTTTYYWLDVGNTGGFSIRWNNSNIGGANSGTTLTTGGYEYQRGTLYTTVSGGKGSPTSYYYRVRRRTTATSETVNTGIPASGTISMNNFYGGRNS